MPRPVLEPDEIDNFIRDYLASHMNLMTFAKTRGINPSTAYRWAYDRGIGIPRRGSADRVERPEDLERLAQEFNDGKSIKQLATENRVARSTMERWLGGAGVRLRNRSEAMFTRMAALSPTERGRLTAAAHEAARGRTLSVAERRQQALARFFDLRVVGMGEDFVGEILAAEGLDSIAQLPIGSYNIDIACWPVAIEVHRKTSHPARMTALRERAVHLANEGWRVLYIWCAARRRGQWCISGKAAEKIVAHVQAAQWNPASVREYRVIRCTGEDAP